MKITLAKYQKDLSLTTCVEILLALTLNTWKPLRTVRISSGATTVIGEKLTVRKDMSILRKTHIGIAADVVAEYVKRLIRRDT